MKKYFYKTILFIILITSFIVVGCKKSNFEITTNFSVIEKEVDDIILINDLYKLTNEKADVCVLIENNEVLSLSDSVITCKSSGESYITISAKLNEKKKEVKILIKVKEKDVYAEDIVCEDVVYINLNDENEDVFNFSILPNNFNKDLIVESSNTSICDFDKENSKLVVNSVGECNIRICAQSSSQDYIEKDVKIIVDDEIYSSSINLLDGNNKFDVFTNSKGEINYKFLDKTNVTKLPIFTTNSKLITITDNGEFETKGEVGIAEINVRYYINYFEYEDIQICANIINKVNIENVAICNLNNTPSINFIVGEDYKYIMEIEFDNDFDSSNLKLPDCIELLEIIEKTDSSLKLIFSFNKADFSSFCIAYNNISYNEVFESKFEIKNLNVVDLKECELVVTYNDKILKSNVENKYNLYLFDEDLYEDDEITNFVQIDFKYDNNSLNEYVNVDASNEEVLRVSDLTIFASFEGESKILVYLFDYIIFELDFVVETIVANEIIIGDYDNILYVGNELLLDVCLDVPYSYNNKIIIEEIDTNYLEIIGNKITAIKYSSDEISLKISCGNLSEFIKITVKYLPDRLECYNLEDFSKIDDEIVINNVEGIYLSFKVYFEDKILTDEIIEIKYFTYNANNEKEYKESDIIVSNTSNNEFCDMVCLKPKNNGIEYVEFVLKSNKNVSKILKIIIENM